MDSAFAVAITIFGTAASVGGVVLYVFNGTRKMIREIHQTINKMDQTMNKMDQTINRLVDMTAKMHEEIKGIHETQRGIKELIAKMDERSEERHKELMGKL